MIRLCIDGRLHEFHGVNEVPLQYRNYIKSNLNNYYTSEDKVIFYIYPENNHIERREIAKSYFITQYP
jgi:hypothetical protein